MTNKTPKYINIKEIIKDGIRTGEIVSKLPGERVMAKMYDVSYMTVRRAITELVEEGILHKFTTKGAFVSHSKMTPKITHNVGFFLDSGIKEGISSPYYSLVFEALEKEVKKKGYNLVLFSDPDDLNPINNQKKIDGVVICCFPRIENKIQELKRMLPIVLLDNLSTDKSIPSVTLDNFNSSSDAANHLFSYGHKRIGFISGLLDSNVCNERLTGYASALVSNDLNVDKKLIFNGDYSYESGESGAAYLLSLKSPPTAIMCANDSMAIGAMKYIRERGYKIPEDISVVGFDDIKVSSMVFPSLTTITVPIARIAERVIAMLLAMIDGVDLDFQHVVLPAPLTVRNSSANVGSKE